MACFATTFWDYKPDDFERFIDARVRLRGNVGTLFGATAQLRGVSLFAGRTSDIEVLESPPDPFRMPVRSIRSLYNYSAAGEVKRRIRISGVVTAMFLAGRSRSATSRAPRDSATFATSIYVDDGSGGARIETEQPLRVRPGTLLEVAGFPTVTPGKPILTNAIFRVVGRGDGSQPAVTVQADSVLDAGQRRHARAHAGPLPQHADEPERARAGMSGSAKRCSTRTSRPMRPRPNGSKTFVPGSLVSVTGVYSYQSGPPPAFHLFLRSADDVRVVSAAPWWTLRHTAVMIVMLTFVAGGAAALGSHGGESQAAGIPGGARASAAESAASCTTRSSRAWPASACSSRPSPAACRHRPRRRASRSTSRGTCCATASKRRGARSMDLRSQALESRDLAGALTDHGASDDAGHERRRRRCAWKGRSSGSTRRRSITCSASASKRSPTPSSTPAPSASASRCGSRTDAVELAVEDNGCGIGQRRCTDSPAACSGCRGFANGSTSSEASCISTASPEKARCLSVVVPIRPSRKPATRSADAG